MVFFLHPRAWCCFLKNKLIIHFGPHDHVPQCMSIYPRIASSICETGSRTLAMRTSRGCSGCNLHQILIVLLHMQLYQTRPKHITNPGDRAEL